MYNQGNLKKHQYHDVRKCEGNILYPWESTLPLGLEYSALDLVLLRKNVPSDKKIIECKKRNLRIFPSPPSDISLISLYNRTSSFFCTKKNPWFQNETFAKEPSKVVKWFAIKVVENSENKSFEEQLSLMAPKDSLLSVIEVIWFEIISRINFKQCILPVCLTRTSTVFVKDKNICVGGSKISGTSISVTHDNKKTCRTINLLTETKI